MKVYVVVLTAPGLGPHAVYRVYTSKTKAKKAAVRLLPRNTQAYHIVEKDVL